MWIVAWRWVCTSLLGNYWETTQCETIAKKTSLALEGLFAAYSINSLMNRHHLFRLRGAWRCTSHGRMLQSPAQKCQCVHCGQTVANLRGGSRHSFHVIHLSPRLPIPYLSRLHFQQYLLYYQNWIQIKWDSSVLRHNLTNHRIYAFQNTLLFCTMYWRTDKTCIKQNIE